MCSNLGVKADHFKCVVHFHPSVVTVWQRWGTFLFEYNNDHVFFLISCAKTMSHDLNFIKHIQDETNTDSTPGLIAHQQLGPSVFPEDWTILQHVITANSFSLKFHSLHIYCSVLFSISFTPSLPDWLLLHSTNGIMLVNQQLLTLRNPDESKGTQISRNLSVSSYWFTNLPNFDQLCLNSSSIKFSSTFLLMLLLLTQTDSRYFLIKTGSLCCAYTILDVVLNLHLFHNSLSDTGFICSTRWK